MSDEQPGVQTPKSETPDEVLSQLQARADELTGKLAKAENVIRDQIAARKKAETALKLKQTDEEQQASDLTQKLEAAEQERLALCDKLAAVARDQAHSAVVAAISTVAPKLVPGADKTLAKLLNLDIKMDDDGQLIVLNDAGQRRLNGKTGKPMTIEELRDEYLANNEFFLAATLKGGKGALGNANATDADVPTLNDVERMTPKELADKYMSMTPEQRAKMRELAGR
jgi:hypothetical protein